MRVLHAPIEIAGQPQLYARALRDLGVYTHSLSFAQHRFGYESDICLNIGGNYTLPMWLSKQAWALAQLMNRYDLFHFHYGMSFLPRNLDLPLLRAIGKRTVMHFWGSDARRSSMTPLPRLARRPELQILKTLERLGRFVDMVLVPDGELRSYVEGFFSRVETVPQIVSLGSLHYEHPQARSEIRVLHAPTDRVIKGTEAVIQAIDTLRNRGHRVTLDLAENVPHSQLLRRITESDIVVDQLRIGVHGIFATEAMALGRPVICYVHPLYRNSYPADLPIVSANEITLLTALEELIVNADLRLMLGRAGRKYVNARHSSHQVGLLLLNIYKSLWPAGDAP